MSFFVRTKDRHSCKLKIGDLVFQEERCVIEGDGKKYLVFCARKGFGSKVRIRIAEGAWQSTARDVVKLRGVGPAQEQEIARALLQS